MLCWLLAAALLEMVTAPVSSGDDGTQSATWDASSSDLVKPDSVSAMVTARASGEPVEVLSDRTDSMQVFAMPDGTWKRDSATGPVRMQDRNGEWHDLDSTLKTTEFGLEPAFAGTGLVFSKGGTRTFASVQRNGRTLEFRWPGVLPKPTVDGASATYVGVSAGGKGDLVVTATPGGFRHEIVLRERPTGPVRIVMPLGLDGGKMVESQATGRLAAYDKAGKVIASGARPLMWDAEMNSVGDPANVRPVTTDITTDADGMTSVELSPIDDFLSDPSTTYPVVIDPSYTLFPVGDTWVQNSGYTTSQYASSELRAGSYDAGDHVARSFLKFSASSYTGQHVVAATLRLRNWYSGSCTGNAIRVNRLTQYWNTETMTWANQPTATSTDEVDFSPAYGYGAGCAEDYATWDVTDMVDRWASGAATNYGMRLRGVNEGSSYTWRKYRSEDYSNGANWANPHLIVITNHYPGIATTPTVVGGQVYTPSGGSAQIYTNDTTPKFTAKASDSDGSTVRYNLEVHMTTAGSGVRAECTTSYVAQGTSASCSVPSADALTDGATYYARAKAYDGTDWAGGSEAASAGWSSWATIKVDATNPTVSVSSSHFTNGQWSESPPGSSIFTFNGSTDVASLEAVVDGVLSQLPSDSAGDATLTWTTGMGSHLVKVTAIDRAGNQSEVVTFSFGAGAAGFAVPNENARSTSTFPVELTGPPDATEAVLSWRMNSDTEWRDANAVSTDGEEWTGEVATSGGRTTTGALVWNAAAEELEEDAEVEAPALLELRGCLTYASGASRCSPARKVQLVPSAFGGNHPVTHLGPASVALFTGEASLSEMDAADSGAGIARTFTSFDSATTSAGAFGPGWSDPQLETGAADTSAQIVDNRDSSGALVVVHSDGGAQMFVPNGSSSTDFIPLEPTGNDTSLLFSEGSAGNPDTLVLNRPVGSGSVQTTWARELVDPDADPATGERDWIVVSAAPSPLETLEFESFGSNLTWIRESAPDAATVCTPAIQKPGCRALTVNYVGDGSDARVASVDRVIGKENQGDVVSTTLATYTYESGMLDSVCSGIPGPDEPPLCATYTYTTVGGRALIAEAQSPGLRAWRFAYDGSGRLTSVSREKQTGGDAVWSVDYDLEPGDLGLPDLSASAAADWGQSAIPTRVFAVYSPVAGDSDATKSELAFTLDDGTVTNTAKYGPEGWLVETNWYDAAGNVVQNLDSNGWTRVQAAAQVDRQQVAAEASTYTLYNDWGDADTVGTRVVDQYGPAHTATLKDGTTGLFRTHTRSTYDDSPEVDPALISTRPPGVDGLGLVVQETVSVSDASRSADYDALETRYGYAPVVSGDGVGWDLGNPTTVSTQVDGLTWSTHVSRFDGSGRTIETRRPGGAADGSGAGTDARTRVSSYYTPDGTGDCGGKPAWAGLLCKEWPADQPPGASIPATFVSSYDSGLRPSVVQETSGTADRTTTTTYDNLARVDQIMIETSGAGVLNEAIQTDVDYDPDSGLQSAVVSNGISVTTEFDSWGRPTNYADATGAMSTSTYDAGSQLETFNDGSGTYAYDYDAYGRLDGIDAGGGVGTFLYAYTPAGYVKSITYPNGMEAAFEYDEIGTQIGLSYQQSGTELLGFSVDRDAGGRVLGRSSPASAQALTHDGLGRLVTVESSGPDGCTTRHYGFDSASNRTSVASFAASPGNLACQTSTSSGTRSNTYDSAGRITNSAYDYDLFGRALTVPQVDGGPVAAGPVAANYHANDMIATLAQAVPNGSGGTNNLSKSYGLDPQGRIHSITTTTNASETNRIRYRFADGSDNPARVEESNNAGASWTSTRYVSLPGIGMAATSAGGAVSLNMSNLSGDIVSAISNLPGSSTPDWYSEADEYGQTTSSLTVRYGWLGSKQRSNDTLGGFVLMGARVYNPSTGMFLQADSMLDGGATVYGYPYDPVNMTDTTGKWWWVTAVTSNRISRGKAIDLAERLEIGANTWSKAMWIIGFFTGTAYIDAVEARIKSWARKVGLGIVGSGIASLLALPGKVLGGPGSFCDAMADHIWKALARNGRHPYVKVKMGIKGRDLFLFVNKYWFGSVAWTTY